MKHLKAEDVQLEQMILQRPFDVEVVEKLGFKLRVDKYPDPDKPSTYAAYDLRIDGEMKAFPDYVLSVCVDRKTKLSLTYFRRKVLETEQAKDALKALQVHIADCKKASNHSLV